MSTADPSSPSSSPSPSESDPNNISESHLPNTKSETKEPTATPSSSSSPSPTPLSPPSFDSLVGSHQVLLFPLSSPSPCPSPQSVSLSSLYSDSPCLFFFLRRFGCVLCRVSALRFSLLKERFSSVGIRLIAVGFENNPKFIEEFRSENYWSGGDLIVDTDLNVYNTLKMNKMGMFQAVKNMFNQQNREAITKANKLKVNGNLKGEGRQMGGTFVVTKGGKDILYSQIQKDFSDEPNFSALLQQLSKHFAQIDTSAVGSTNQKEILTEKEAEKANAKSENGEC